MDALRGTAIVLVVVNHSILFSVPFGGAPTPAVVFNEIFAPLRMPLMVFLSGLLLARSLEKGWRRYAAGKARRILWPYLVWSLIVIAIDSLTNVVSGDAPPLGDLARVFYSPLAHLWFLYYLLAYYVIALVTRRVNPLLVAALALAVCAAVPSADWQRFLLLLTAFMAGKWVSDRPTRLEEALRRPWVVGVSAFVFAAGAAVAVAGFGLRYNAASAPFVVGGVIAAIALARRVADSAVMRPILFTGRYSLIFYLTHWYGVILAVQLANRLMGDPWVTFLAGVLGGLIAGTVFAWATRMVLPLNFLFELPRRSPESLRVHEPA
jgi:uncharacterized membrane protein YcfT